MGFKRAVEDVRPYSNTTNQINENGFANEMKEE